MQLRPFFPLIIFILLCFNVLSTVPRENRPADFLYIYIYIYIYIYRQIDRQIDRYRALAPHQTFPVNPPKKHKYLHIKLGKNHAYAPKNNQSNKWLLECQFSWSDLHLIQATIYPSHFHCRYYFTKRIELLVFSFKNVFFQPEQKVRNFFPSIDLCAGLLK